MHHQHLARISGELYVWHAGPKRGATGHSLRKPRAYDKKKQICHVPNGVFGENLRLQHGHARSIGARKNPPVFAVCVNPVNRMTQKTGIIEDVASASVRFQHVSVVYTNVATILDILEAKGSYVVCVQE